MTGLGLGRVVIEQCFLHLPCHGLVVALGVVHRVVHRVPLGVGHRVPLGVP